MTDGKKDAEIGRKRRLHGLDENSSLLLDLRRRRPTSSVSTSPKETYAIYFANRLLEKGYTPSDIPELAGLASDCDYLLIKIDGLHGEAIAIIDRDLHPARVFTISSSKIFAISEECAKYTGHVGRTKLPFLIQLYEIGAGIIDQPAKERMGAYRNLWTKGIAHPWMLDTKPSVGGPIGRWRGAGSASMRSGSCGEASSTAQQHSESQRQFIG